MRAFDRFCFRIVLLALPASVSVYADSIFIGPYRFDHTVQAEVSIVDNAGSLTDSRVATSLEPGFQHRAEALVGHAPGPNDPTGPNNKPEFASALTINNGTLEVGVNGYGPGKTLNAISYYIVTATNSSDFPLTIGFDFVIPFGEIILFDAGQGLDSSTPGRPLGTISANISYFLGPGSGFFEPIFSYGVTVAGGGGGTGVETIGDPVVRSVSDPNRSEYGYEVSEYTGRVIFPEIPAGERLIFLYEMKATGYVARGETRVDARIGDPFDLFGTGGGSATFFVHSAASEVPEPVSLALAGFGLVLVGFMRRRCTSQR